MLHSVRDYHQRGVGWRHSTPGGPNCTPLQTLFHVLKGGGYGKWFQSKYSLPNLLPQGCSPKANWKIWNRCKKETFVGLVVKPCWMKAFSVACRRHFFCLFFGYEHLNMYRPENKHWCVFHTHSIVGLHCLNTPPALVLFVDSIKQMVRKPITQGGMKWNAMCMCVDIMCVRCVRGPSLALQVSLGFLVTLCLGGESAGDNWTLPGTFNKCIERRNRKTC